jgi:hypothetical protein
MTTRAITSPPTSSTTKVNFSLSLSGIGTNVAVGQNNNPLHPTRDAVVQIRNASNNVVQSINTTVSYSTSSGLYSGSVLISSLTSGNYYNIAVKLSNTLNKLANNWFQPGGTVNEPTIIPISGDVDGNNAIDIRDYNDLMSCYGAKANTSSCQYKTTSDLNDDGSIGGVDYNIIIRAFSGQS